MDTSAMVEHVLVHFGVRGQKWGVRRKATVGAQEVVVSDKRKKLKTSGGAGHPASSDAVRARTIGQVGKKSGTKALSNADLKVFNERLNLEQNYKRLTFQDQSKGRQFVSKMLGRGVTKGVESGGKAALNSSYAKKRIGRGATALAAVL